MAAVPEEIIARIIALLSPDDFITKGKDSEQTDATDDVDEKPWNLSTDSSDYIPTTRVDYWSEDRLSCQEQYERAMAKFCLVSHSFRRTAQCLLFETFTMPSQNRYTCSTDYNLDEKPYLKLRLLLRTLLECPELVVFLKEAQLEYGPPQYLAKAPTYPQQVKLNETRLPKCMLPYLQDLRDGICGSEIALLLCLCNNVHTISISITTSGNINRQPLLRLIRSQWGPKVFDSQPPASRSEPNILAKLCNLSLGQNGGLYDTPMETIATLLRLPNIKYFRGARMPAVVEPVHVYRAEGTTERPFRGLNFTGLTQLHLWKSEWDPSSIKHILQVASAIQSLELHALEGWNKNPDYKALGDVLRVHGQCIKRLIIDPTANPSWDRRYEYGGQSVSNARLGSLKTLQSLHYVETPMDILVDPRLVEERGSSQPLDLYSYGEEEDRELNKIISAHHKSLRVYHNNLNALYTILVDSVLPANSAMTIYLIERGLLRIDGENVKFGPRKDREQGPHYDLEYIFT